MNVGAPVSPAVSTAHRHPIQTALGLAMVVAGPLVVSWATVDPSWPGLSREVWSRLDHLMDTVTVVLATLIFVTAYSTSLSPRKGTSVWLGFAFSCVGMLTLLHLITDEPGGGPDIAAAPTASVWYLLLARLVSIAAMLFYSLAPALPSVALRTKRHILAAGMGVFGGLVLVEWLGVASPLARIPAPQGAFHVLTGVLGGAALLVQLWRQKTLAAECAMAVAFAVVFAAESEWLFVGGGDAFNLLSLALAHLYTALSYLFLFHATFHEAHSRPLKQLQNQHRREHASLSAAPDGVIWVDSKGCIQLANPAVEQLTGYGIAELVGQSVDIFLPPRLREAHGASVRSYFTDPHPRAMGSMDLKLMRRDGGLLPVDISLGYWEDDGHRYAIAYIRDLTERKKFEETLRHQATHDELTGMPNRWLFNIQLSQALSQASRAGRHVAVLVLDLDHFKAVNDSFGHSAGDTLLVQVAGRLKACLRENDVLARLGGDEFAILITDLVKPSHALGVATKLLNVLQSIYRLEQHDLHSSGSLGLAFFPDDGRDGETLLRYADMAMYHAKQSGRGAFACYSPTMDHRAKEDLLLHSHLKEAIGRGELELHYQPQIELDTGVVTGVEALLRWRDDALGQVPPARFIPVAEATGLILPLSDWVLETACRQIEQWCRAGTPMSVAVNCSAQQFYQRNLPDKVGQVLARTGADARWLVIEITETVATKHPQQTREQIEALVAMGCRVALDDFGTGYSSLSTLKALPVSELKIDKSFMDGIPDDANDVAIARAIMVMARSLGLNIVAEGVERSEQLDFLHQHGCTTCQGWLFAKAMPAREVETLFNVDTAAATWHTARIALPTRGTPLTQKTIVGELS